MSVRRCRIFFLSLVLVFPALAPAADAPAGRVAVYFSPAGGATNAVIREINAATQQILVQAYAFTSAPIAKALIEAHKRGVRVTAVLDKSNEAATYTAATLLLSMGIETRIDARHAIAHNKVMVLDHATLITGSFNFTAQAETKNAENLLVIKDSPALIAAYEANIQAHAAHAHPYTRAVAPVPTPSAGAVRGNQRSKVYRLPSCKGYTAMTSSSVVVFLHEEAAREAGYRRAKNCP